MTNAEKARELCKLYQANRASLFQHLLAMAEWKDEQLREKLKKKMDFFYPPIDDYNEGKLAVLKDLYQELFDEYYI